MDDAEIADWASRETPANARDRWAWITGGEPADHDLRPLISELRKERFSIAIASSGHKRFTPPVDWLSISPHGMEQVQMYGNEIKLVPGLGGLDPWEWCRRYDATSDFWYRYVQPMEIDGKEINLDECKRFLADHPNWALSRQDHKHWEYP